VERTKDMKRKTKTLLFRNQLVRRVTRMSKRNTSLSKRRMILIKSQLKTWEWPPLEIRAVVIEF